MEEPSRNGEPTEIVYLPDSSWLPALIALGIAAVIASLFTWWPYGVIGAVLALAALRSWVVDSGRHYEKLPRRQRVATSVIPAVPLERERD
jgi:predicted lysophospholipase L1 biosynthesis ABC-type transport system permease subunit